MQSVGRVGKSFDGLYFRAVGLDGEHQARAYRCAIDEHRTCAANTVLAADMGTGKSEFVAQEIREQQSRLDLSLEDAPIDFGRN